MKLQIISDVHLEFPNAFESIGDFPVLGDAIALLGDIGYPAFPQYKKFLQKLASKFSLIFVIAGNHEFYKSEYYSTKKLIRQICQECGANVIFLDRNTYLYNDKNTTSTLQGEEEGEEKPAVGKKIRFLGCTLWSAISEEQKAAVKENMADYDYIQIEEYQGAGKFRKLKPADTIKIHKREVKWLRDNIELAKQNNETVVVLTHHAPLLKGTSSNAHAQSEVSSAFASQLDYLMQSHVHTWCFGHTHHSCNFVYKTTRVVSNQFGYVTTGESCGFNKQLVLEIDEIPGAAKKTQGEEILCANATTICAARSSSSERS